MMRVVLWALIVLAVFAAGWLLTVGRDGTWRLIAGPADLGPVNFATLARRTSPNDALSCPGEFCPNAISDVPPRSFQVAPEQLKATIDRALAGEINLERVDDQTDPLYRRYVQRSEAFRFPDTIDIRILPPSDSGQTHMADGSNRVETQLALYSRSQLGRSDFGVNQARLIRWLDEIQSQLTTESGSNP